MQGPGVVVPLVWLFVPDFLPSVASKHRNRISHSPSVLVAHIPYAPRLQCQTSTTFSVVFQSHLAELEAEFNANLLLLHISHFSRLMQSQNSTNTTSQNCTEENTSSQQNAAGRVVNKGCSSRDLVVCSCTTSGFHAAFQFRGFGSTMYMCIMYSFSLTLVRHRGGISNETMPVAAADTAVKYTTEL